MQLREIIAVALSSLRANKLRSGLTMLGIIIGIAAVIAVVGLGLGAQRAVQRSTGSARDDAPYASTRSVSVAAACSGRTRSD